MKGERAPVVLPGWVGIVRAATVCVLAIATVGFFIAMCPFNWQEALLVSVLPVVVVLAMWDSRSFLELAVMIGICLLITLAEVGVIYHLLVPGQFGRYA